MTYNGSQSTIHRLIVFDALVNLYNMLLISFFSGNQVTTRCKRATSHENLCSMKNMACKASEMQHNNDYFWNRLKMVLFECIPQTSL